MLVKGATGDKALYHPLFLTSLEENIYSHYYHHVTRMMLWATNKCFQHTYAFFRVFRVLDESGVGTETRMVTHRVLTGLVTPAIVISTLVDIWGNRDYRLNVRTWIHNRSLKWFQSVSELYVLYRKTIMVPVTVSPKTCANLPYENVYLGITLRFEGCNGKYFINDDKTHCCTT